jgi:hypothetical protein
MLFYSIRTINTVYQYRTHRTYPYVVGKIQLGTQRYQNFKKSLYCVFFLSSSEMVRWEDASGEALTSTFLLYYCLKEDQKLYLVLAKCSLSKSVLIVCKTLIV